MSKISFNRIVPLVAKSPPADVVQHLLREIIVLQAKLEHLDQQDLYFQKGQKSHESRLENMQAEYSRIVDLINNHEVDYFLEQIREAEAKFHEICSKESKHPVFAKVLVDKHINSEIAYLRMLVQAKGDYQKLLPLHELMQDERALLKIFE